MKRRRTRGCGSLYLRGRTWWIAYTVDRELVRESTGLVGRELKDDAEQVLRDKLSEVARGLRPTGQRPTLATLAELVRADYKANERRSTGRLEASLSHLEEYFGAGALASSITVDRVTAYVAARKAAKAENATINRELAALRRGFRLAVKAQRLEARPLFSLLAENNARKGFLEPGQFAELARRLPGDLRGLVEVAYITGWRIVSELLTRQWRHVDFNGAGWLRLEPGETKNQDGRMFPFTPRLRAILEGQQRAAAAAEKKLGRVIPWVFHRNGAAISRHALREAWESARAAAGLPGKLLHDFRRTAVRNLERAGVPRSSAMKMVGHKTESIYRRYAIVDEAMLQEAAARLAVLHTSFTSGRRRNRLSGAGGGS